MAGKGSPPGVKQGGRKKGVPNRATVDLLDRLNELGVYPEDVLACVSAGSPLECLVGLNKDTGDYVIDKVPPTMEQRINAAKELMQYKFPKRKAIDHTTNGQSIIINASERDLKL